MRFDGFAAILKRFRVLGGTALVLAAAVAPVAPAAAEPAFSRTDTIRLYPGTEVFYPVQGVFADFGTNPEYGSVTFSTEEYINSSLTGLGSSSGVDPDAETVDHLIVAVLTNEQLLSLDPQPANPFTFTADVTMTNDEDETASGTLTFEVTYDRPVGQPPVFTLTDTIRLDTLSPSPTHIPVIGVFANSGTNPVYSNVTFSTTAYIDSSRTGFGSWSGLEPNAETGDHLLIAVLTNSELGALDPQPDNPFTFTAHVTMTNDEGHAASGTLTFETTWYPHLARPLPAFRDPGTVAAAPGQTLTYEADDLFDNGGTDPIISGAVFSTTEYYSTHSVQNGVLHVQPKTALELSALETPPPSPFTVDVTVTMINQEGRTASGTVTFETTYDVTDLEDLPLGRHRATGGPLRIDQ
ncbi:MAG: hypothetical protein OXN81_10175 [Alphaproteobacteria bacterium]|nr:hypothetical protein [Alphaproteobacteria bacterium]